MLIKSSSRGTSQTDVDRLARHLVAKDNETVVFLEGCDDAASLRLVLSEMRAITMATRSRRALFHASLSLPADEAFSLNDKRWIEAIDTLERLQGLTGHKRVVIGHCKKGRRHLHAIWCRANDDLRIASDAHNFYKNEFAARELERRWNLCPVVGVHTRPAGTSRPVARMNHQEWQGQRTGIMVSDVASILSTAWASTTTGQDFASAIQTAGIQLAIGRRGIIAVDGAGTPFSLSRRLGLRAGEIQRRLADIDIATLPTVEAVKVSINQSKTTGRNEMPAAYGAAARRPRRRDQKTIPPLPASYWEGLGYSVERLAASLLIKLSPNCEIEDRGDRLLLHRKVGGAPTDAELRVLVAAAKAHMDAPAGWDGVQFTGSPADQRRMRAIALEMGIPASAIALECEEAPGVQAPPKMPDHVRRRLKPSQAPEGKVPAGEVPPPSPTPAQEVRP
ncbi:MAG TPA: hypothetical protein VK558_11735 [Patescibacteria group bacterium]|nr:hypothetical protein [Patescibacteria group bacterium]